MVEQSWIPRHCLGWLLAAQLALIAPHLTHLPIWIALAWVVSAGWRVLVFQGRASFPNKWIKALLVFGSLAGVHASYRSWLGLEPTVALLIACFSFKLLEAAARRDAYLLLFLGYFVALTEFLFEQGLGITLYMMVPVLLLTTALLALQQQEPLRFNWRPLRTAGVMSAQALPLMLLLFLVTPRLAPLWQVPMPGAAARTGMSDQVAPGDIAQLSQSDELAFRVLFKGEAPAQSELYWRGVVLDEFDGRRWLSSRVGDLPLSGLEPEPSGPALEYEVFLEPTHRRWLYTLQRPQGIEPRMVHTIDYRLLARDPVHEKFYYRTQSYLQAPMDPAGLDPRLRKLNMLVPLDGNARARALAVQLREQHSDDAALVEAALALFRTQPFVYTLEPPVLGQDSIDQFLFETRSGFCEHYASSFAFLMRVAKIPARVVAGYQGGEMNPLSGAILLHQYDAHAWVEVWFEGRGWLRVDPTAAVSPLRIERGIENALGSEFLSQAPLSVNRYRNLDLINTLRLRLDMINYSWTRWVVNYRDETQTALLERLLGEISPLRMVLFVVGGGGVVLGAVALMLLGRNIGPRLPPEQRYYREFCRRMARLGYPRAPGIAPSVYARNVLAQQPQWQRVLEITACFESLSYRSLKPGQRRLLLRRLRSLVKSWRP